MKLYMPFISSNIHEIFEISIGYRPEFLYTNDTKYFFNIKNERKYAFQLEDYLKYYSDQSNSVIELSGNNEEWTVSKFLNNVDIEKLKKLKVLI